MEPASPQTPSPGLVLVFHLDDLQYGLPVEIVREIIPMVEITPVPKAPPFLRGVINLRGTIVPVVELRRKLRLPERLPDEHTCLVVVSGPDRSFGFLADRVTDCLEIDRLESPEGRDLETPADRRFIQGVSQQNGRIIVILYPDSLLTPVERRVLKSV